MLIKKDIFTYYISIFLFIFISLLFFIQSNEFYLSNGTAFIVQDSKFYFESAKLYNGFEGLLIISSLNKNLFGPFLYFNILLNSSRILFYFITFLFLFYALKNLYKYMNKEKNKNIILLLLLFNPIVLTSLSGPNKEITGYISILYIINYIYYNNNKYIILSIFFALFTRFELLFIIIFFLYIQKKSLKYQLLSVLILITAISIIVAKYDYSYEYMLNNMEIRSNSLGLVQFLGSLNQEGFYILTFIPKFFLNSFGDILALNIFSLSGYSLIIYFSQVLTLILLFYIIKKKRLSFKNNLFILFFVFCLIFTIPVFIQHRYFIPIYPVLVILAFSSKSQKDIIKL